MTIERAQLIILADAIAAGRKANGGIILVVDELLKCELLNGKRYPSMTATVLQTLSTSMAHDVRVVVSSLTPELSGLTKSGSERPFVALYLPQLRPLVKLVPAHLNRSDRNVTVEAVQRLLDDLAYQSLLQDTAGVPRLMEVVYWHAAEWLRRGFQHAVRRESLLEILAAQPRLETYYREESPIVRALEAVFLGWRVLGAVPKSELSHEEAALIRTGHLQLLKPAARTDPFVSFPLTSQSIGIPPLMLYLWFRHDDARSHPLLRAVLKFLYWDDPTTYSGQSFERQLVALWKLLYAADAIWRRSPALPNQPACLRSAIPGLPSTLQGMLGCERFPESIGPLATNSCLLQDFPGGVYPADDGEFNTGAAVDALPLGLSVPRESNHPGFDFLDVRVTVDGDHRFYTAVEAKFTQSKTHIDGDEVADKLVITLTRYPELLAALCAGRFCFVLAAFQRLADSHTPSSIGQLAHAKLSKRGMVSPPSEAQLAPSLVLLRRPHLEMLLTATLRSRAQFVRAVDNPELLPMQRAQSRLYAEQQQHSNSQATVPAEKRGPTGDLGADIGTKRPRT